MTVTFDADGKASCTLPQLEPQLALTEVSDPDLRSYSKSSVTLSIDNLSQEEYFSSWDCYFEDMKGDRTLIGNPSAMITPQDQQKVRVDISKLPLPAGTKGNIILQGTYVNEGGADSGYALRSSQRLEVLPAEASVSKAASIKCVARRSITGAIERAPETSAITFEITNQGNQKSSKLLVEWTLLLHTSRGASVQNQGQKIIQNLPAHKTVQYSIDPSSWFQMSKRSSYSLRIRLFDVIEHGVNMYYGEQYHELTLPIVVVDQLSLPIDEEHYVSLEKESDHSYSLMVDVAAPEMIRLYGLTLMSLSHEDGVYKIHGAVDQGRTSIIGTFTSLVFDQKDDSTGIVEADFSHASPLLQHISMCHSKIRGKAMTEMLQSLPDRSATTRGTIALIDTSRPDLEGSICTPEQVKLAAERGWTVTDQQGNAYTAIDTPAEAMQSDWTIYPMPVRDQMTVVGLPATSSVTLYTLQGERLLEAVTPASGQLQISLVHLPSDTYILNTALGSRRVVVAH